MVTGPALAACAASAQSPPPRAWPQLQDATATDPTDRKTDLSTLQSIALATFAAIEPSAAASAVLICLSAAEARIAPFATARSDALSMGGIATSTGIVVSALDSSDAIAFGSDFASDLRYPIQGINAVIAMNAMIRIDRALHDQRIDGGLVIFNHDEFVLEVREADAERAGVLLKEAMELAFVEMFPAATLKGLVEVKTGRNWAETKEKKAPEPKPATPEVANDL